MPIRILLIEDNPADIRLTQEALKEAKVANELHVARDGVEAMQLLTRDGHASPVPDLILLDLNLPRKDGREVLEEIKRNSRLRHIPIIVLTTSEAHQDIQRTYELSANAFVTKPLDVDEFFRVIAAIEQFWLRVASLPSGRHRG